MNLNMIVLVKQVPDTQNVTGEAMRPDGTVNRDALPAIFNPEDLNALEEALKIKDQCGGSVTAISMGPPKAVEVLKDCLYRGADKAILVSDRAFAGSDTLATSYALTCAVRRLSGFDLIFCGRQAIDGDTAQVGPQVAEKLGINQLTGVSEILSVSGDRLEVKRLIEDGYEKLAAPLPLLLTVTAEANEPRSAGAKRVMCFKRIDCREDAEGTDCWQCEPIDHVKNWNMASIGADPERCGFSGSATWVKKIENVVLTTQETKRIENTDQGISGLIRELVDEHII
ncbi:MAG: electron transfer flavoprotein subunit beta/FixA family protein [Desulfohalobiaceae bacterium]|nr:electron transfer flavoprotein subunit beta/FixA family protein [Desulfohalobiaceae bacterium]